MHILYIYIYHMYMLYVYIFTCREFLRHEHESQPFCEHRTFEFCKVEITSIAPASAMRV